MGPSIGERLPPCREIWPRVLSFCVLRRRPRPEREAAFRAHVHRKFEETAPDHPEANLALGWIGELYGIDERAGPALDSRALLRRTESTQGLAKLKTWLWPERWLETQSIGKAAAYAIANWERLTRVVDDPRTLLDNNAPSAASVVPSSGGRTIDMIERIESLAASSLVACCAFQDIARTAALAQRLRVAILLLSLGGHR